MNNFDNSINRNIPVNGISFNKQNSVNEPNSAPAEYEYREGSSLNLDPAAMINYSAVQHTHRVLEDTAIYELTHLDGMDGSQLSEQDVRNFLYLIKETPEVYEKIKDFLLLTPEQLEKRNNKPIEASVIEYIFDGEYSDEQIGIIKDVFVSTDLISKHCEWALNVASGLNFDKDLIDMFKELYSAKLPLKPNENNPLNDIYKLMDIVSKCKNIDYIKAFKKILESGNTRLQLGTMGAPVFIDFPERMERVINFVDIAKDNTELLKNLNLEFFLQEDKYNLVMDSIKENPDITYIDLSNRLTDFNLKQSIEKINQEAYMIQNPMVKSVAVDSRLKIKSSLELFEEIDSKMNNIKDEKVVEFINSLFNDYQNALNSSDTKFNYVGTLEKINSYLDIYHTLSADYEYIGDISQKETAKRKYIDFIKKNNDTDNYVSREIDKYYNEPANDSGIEIVQASDKAYRRFQDYHESDSIDVGRFKDMLDEEKIDRLRYFCTHNPDDKVAEYFYDEYYVKNSNIPKVLADKLEKINKEFNVKIFLSHGNLENSEKELYYAYKELSIWKKHSNGKAVFPPVIDLSAIKRGYIDNKSAYGQGASAGCAYSSSTKHIELNGYSNIPYALRHELTHINDTKRGYNIGSQYELTKIMPKKIENGVDIPDFQNCQYKEEFLRAGIKPEHISYAYNNTQEFIAVAAEGDMSKYSPEFRKILVDFGMPEWMFDMEVQNEDVKNRVEYTSFVYDTNESIGVYFLFDAFNEEVNLLKNYQSWIDFYEPDLIEEEEQKEKAKIAYQKKVELDDKLYDSLIKYGIKDGFSRALAKYYVDNTFGGILCGDFDLDKYVNDISLIMNFYSKNMDKDKITPAFLHDEYNTVCEFKESVEKHLKKHPEISHQVSEKEICELYLELKTNIGEEIKQRKASNPELHFKFYVIHDILSKEEDILSILNGTFDKNEYINRHLEENIIKRSYDN